MTLLIGLEISISIRTRTRTRIRRGAQLGQACPRHGFGQLLDRPSLFAEEGGGAGGAGGGGVRAPSFSALFVMVLVPLLAGGIHGTHTARRYSTRGVDGRQVEGVANLHSQRRAWENAGEWSQFTRSWFELFETSTRSLTVPYYPTLAPR